MEDWTSYCGQLDQITLINVDETKVKDWRAKEYITIEEDNPCRIAKELALQDWSYSEDAVVAVIKDEFAVIDNEVSNLIEGSIPIANTYKKTLTKIKQTNSLSPVSKQFEVGDEYQLIKAEAWWDGALIAGKMVPDTRAAFLPMTVMALGLFTIPLERRANSSGNMAISFASNPEAARETSWILNQ